ncbi:cytochrome P450 [Zopfia rhizophila CBS 207.26]|uniref:Cytochrome P450 n=1 Tax=Zopfia rhizophila CBS 207.26 TaxID=1314779 RepID=A0A6A6E020_9PEZI|nr:cytochrome P450 [Zopfia rhizophila CBS 207.26]
MLNGSGPSGAGFTVIALLLSVTLVTYYFWTLDPRRKHLPPLVPGLPLIRQTFFHARDSQILEAVEWKKTQGDLFRTRAGSTDYVWLNTPEAIKEICDRRSAIYSSRMPLPMAHDTVSGGYRLVFMPYSKRWRTVRTIIHRLLTPAAAKSYAPIQEFEAKQLSVDLLDTPDEFFKHNRRYSASLILQVTYGRRVPVWDCEDIHQINAINARFGGIRQPGRYLVDTFPRLADNFLFNCISNWKREGEEHHKADAAFWMALWDRMRGEINNGTALHSFGKGFLQSDWASKGLNEMQGAYVLGSMIEAGSETTTMFLNNIIIGLLSRGREVIEAAQEELDRVIGLERTPNFDDEEDLPYIRAMIKEALRWRHVNKLGLTHYATEDGWYNEYFIPKGSVIVANVWGMHYDAERYPKPEMYDPMRFIDHKLGSAQAAAAGDPLARPHFSFGAGRRICPGMHVAERSLFLNVARLLWAFDIRLAKDENGRDIPVDSSFSSLSPGSMTSPKPFQCDIRPRSAQHESVLRNEWNKAQEEGLHLEEINFAR